MLFKPPTIYMQTAGGGSGSLLDQVNIPNVMPDGMFTSKIGGSWYQAYRLGGHEYYLKPDGDPNKPPTGTGNDPNWSSSFEGSPALATTAVKPDQWKQVHDTETGAVYAIDPSRPDADPITIIGPNANKVARETAQLGLSQADIQYRNMQIAKAQAQAPYDAARAKATIDNMESQIAARNASLGPKLDLIKQRTQALIDAAGLTNVKKGEITARTAMDWAKASPIWGRAEGEILQLMELRDKNLLVPKGSAADNAEEFNKQAQIIMDNARQEALTGMSSTERATLAKTDETEAVSQANNRATVAGSLFGNALDTVNKIAAGAAPGQGAALAGGLSALLHASPDFVKSMGGGTVPIPQPGGGVAGAGPMAQYNLPLDINDKLAITAMVRSGVPFQQAVQAQAQAKAAGGGGGQDAAGGQGGAPTTDPWSGLPHQTGAIWNGQNWINPDATMNDQTGTAPADQLGGIVGGLRSLSGVMA